MDQNNSEIKMFESLLQQAATVWTKLMGYRYEFVYGYKKTLYTIRLTFSASDFYHLAGFQYLDDLALPRYNSARLISKILSGTMTQDQIEKSSQYQEMVYPRLTALASLDKILDNTFQLFSYRPEVYSSFHTSIRADYLLSSTVNGVTYVFLFGGKPGAQVRDCICRSIFRQGTRNYEENQHLYTLLQKNKIDLATGDETVLYKKNGFNPDPGAAQ